MSAHSPLVRSVFLRVALVPSLLSLGFASQAVAITPSAIPGKDERNFAHPTSRCLTAAMKKLNAAAMKRMQADVAAAEKRLGKKFEPELEAPKPMPVEQRACSTDVEGPRVCTVGLMAAGKAYRVEFSGLVGQRSDMIVISPLQGGVSSPMLSVQAAMTGGMATGTVAFDGLPVGEYTAFVFSNPDGDDRGAEPRASVSFTVDEKPRIATLNGDVSPPLTKKTSADVYKEKLETVWSAMYEPYCGYGSRGVAAVQKSYNKSVERIRAEFLKATMPAPAFPPAAQVDPKAAVKK